MLKIENLGYKTGKFRLKNINLEIYAGEYFILLGPTGSGKTTLLKCILGLNKITDNGRVFLDGKDITDSCPEERYISVLPQNYLLFPNMNVYQNISFGLSVKKYSKAKINEKVIKISEILNIPHILDRDIENLSGGEAQKAGLARAIVTDPKLLLLDEPFSAIDYGSKSELWFEIKTILKKLNIPVLHITHNQDEGYALGDRIGVMMNGEISRIDSPQNIFNKPGTEAEAKFLGMKNIFDGTVAGIDSGNIHIDCGRNKITASSSEIIPCPEIGGRVRICIRENAVKVIKENTGIREELKMNIFDGEIVSSYFFSDTCIMKVNIGLVLEMKFPIYIYKRHNLSIGQKIKIGIWKEGIIILPVPEEKKV